VRTPDEIMADFDRAAKGQADIAIHDALWEVIEDIQDSYRLAMEGAGLTAAQIEEVSGTVSGYVVNHYGD
jgi:hypothetical protein